MRILLTAILTLIMTAAQTQPLRFHQLTVKDGLPNNGVIGLGQDGKGQVWVATLSGLCVYDGRQFVTIPVEGLPDKRVNRIHCDRHGTVWVQCFEHHQQVSRYDTLYHRFVTYDLSSLSDSVRRLSVQPYCRTFADPRSSRVWTVEKRQLWQIDTLQPKEKFAYTGAAAIDAGLKDESVNTVLLDNRGVLWVASATGGLFFADTRHSHYRRIVCQPNPLVRSVCRDKSGTLWVAIGNEGLWKSRSSHYEPADYPMRDSVEGRRIRTIVEDSKGRLWVGTHDGLFLKSAGSEIFESFVFSDNIGRQIFSLCEDKQGEFWISSETGLYRLPAVESPQQMRPVLIDSVRSFVLDMASDRNGLYMATERGLFSRQAGHETRWNQEVTRTVATDAAGNVWAGTDQGLCLLTPQGLEPIATPADGHVVKALFCHRDFVWCCYDLRVCCVNVYTRQAILLRTEHNEYNDRATCFDANTGTLYFEGTLGIDCFVPDSLDEQLRSGAPQIWLEEVSEELMEKEDEPAPASWTYLVALIIIGSGILCFTYYYKRRRRATDSIVVEQQDIDSQSQFLRKATSVAEAHIADTSFTAEQMAQEMAMSRSKLFVLMKNETGKAVMEFVRDIRLDYAAQQLMAGSAVNDIYMACGFSDPSSFRRSFAKKFGMPPSQYRAQQSTGKTVS